LLSRVFELENCSARLQTMPPPGSASSSRVHDDERAIRNVIERYFYAHDTRDATAFASCFTADGEATYETEDGQGVTFTVSKIVDWGARLARLASTLHQLASLNVSIHGDTADADTFAVAYLASQDEALVTVRGLRYRDRLVRAADGWRIFRRQHACLWQFQVATAASRLPFGLAE
jgi:hypothetical protein